MAKQTIADLPAAKLDELEAKARAATPGPWHVGSDDLGYDTVNGVEILFDEGLIGDTGASTCSETEDAANAAHIAALDPPTVLSLLAMARGKSAAEERVRELKSELDHYADYCADERQEGFEKGEQIAHEDMKPEFEKLKARAQRTEQERDRLAEALRPFGPINATLEDILWGDQPDDAMVTITTKLAHTRQIARALSSLSPPEKEKAG